jgi:hypothetical protein
MADRLQALDPVADDHLGEPRPPLESGCNRTGGALGASKAGCLGETRQPAGWFRFSATAYRS